MRLTPNQVKSIITILRRYFGAKSRIILFGSRLNDGAKGGDIDLYLEPEMTDSDLVASALVKAKIALYQQLGEQRIDLVVNRKQGLFLPIYEHALSTGVEL